MSQGRARGHRREGPLLVFWKVAWGVFWEQVVQGACSERQGSSWVAGKTWNSDYMMTVPLPCTFQVSFFLPPTAWQREGQGE